MCATGEGMKCHLVVWHNVDGFNYVNLAVIWPSLECFLVYEYTLR